MYIETTATKKIKALKKRIRALQGGTSSSKTISSLLYLIALAQTDTTPTLTSVVAESLPHLKKGAMRDFQNIMKEHRYWNDELWNATDRTYTFETGSRIEFFSVDNEGKARGPRRDRLFVNECNNISFPIFEQLEIRTNEFIILDWNPSHEFWYYTELEGKRDDIDFIILTYKDNEGLPENIVKAIEAKKTNANWWRVYGEGQLGVLESRIYKDWNIIDVIPHEARLIRYGLDFGYTNDPSALIAIYEYNGGYILDEILYEKGLSNKLISDTIKNVPQALVIADSAEPKSIDEIKSYGITILPAEKGRDSVLSGIQYVQGLRISVTSNSVNVIREYRNYNFLTDKDGKVINEPDHDYSHSMDAIRYGLTSCKNSRDETLQEQRNMLLSRRNRDKSTK